MATIEDALRGSVLAAVDLPPWESRLPIRSLYAVPHFFDWADHTPQLHDPKLGVGGRTLFEHLLQTMSEFRCAARPHAGDLRRLIPTGKGLWKMHSPGLRLYGWCPGTDRFAIVKWAMESDTKADKKLNDKKRKEVEAFIKRHHLQQTILRGDHLVVFPHQN